MTTLSDTDRRLAVAYAMSRIAYHRTKVGDKTAFPEYDSTRTELGAGACDIVIGGRPTKNPFLHVFPPAVVGLRKFIDLSDALGAAMSPHATTKLITYHYGGKARQFAPHMDVLPCPTEINQTDYRVFEKLVRDGQGVPRHLWLSIVEYVENGGPLGHALNAIFENNLIRAAASADDEVASSLPAIARFIFNHLPPSCWGSVGAVKTWRKRRLSHNADKAGRAA